MRSIKDDFEKILGEIVGEDNLYYSIFYKVDNALRFEIGYSWAEDEVPSEKYFGKAYRRAKEIYDYVGFNPDILVINTEVDEDITELSRGLNLPICDEKYSYDIYEEIEIIPYIRRLWKVKKDDLFILSLISEIIRTDFGGYDYLASNVYIADSRNYILYHLYDDRGLDLIARDKEKLEPYYKKFGKYILEYDKEKIDKIFK